MKTINYEEMLGLLRKQVEKKGADHVYAQREAGVCVNWTANPDGTRVPDCIAGHVFFEIGGLEHVDAGASWYKALRQLRRAGVAEATTKATLLLARVQSNQDFKMPWGKALDLAVKAVAEIRWNENEDEIRWNENEDEAKDGFERVLEMPA